MVRLGLFIRISLAASCVGASIGCASAGEAGESTFLSSLRLRGGYDENPTLSLGGPPSSFVGLEAAFVAARETSGMVMGLSGEASTIRYLDQTIAPAERGNFVAHVATKPGEGLGLRATTTAGAFSNYDTRSSDVIQAVRAEWQDGMVKPFVTAEAQLSDLNQTNALFPGFLPVPHRFFRAAVIPGLAVKLGDAEVGATVNLSTTRYATELDLFGFARDNERLQPYLFVRYEKDGLKLFANVSRLYGTWRDPDFSNVERTMFEVAGSYDVGRWTFTLDLQRTAAETTFPLSPITVATTLGGTAKRRLDGKSSATVSIRHATLDYLDTPLSSQLLAIGVEARRELWSGFFVGAEATRSHFRPVVGDEVRATAFSLFAMQRFASAPP